MKYETITREDGKQFIVLYIDDNNVRIFEIGPSNPEYEYFARKIAMELE